MKKYLIIASLLSSVVVLAQQYGGMWIPTEINEVEMKKLGMKISAKDIWNTSQPSIKDAVVQFNKGCTGEIISPKGLLLTNHHCGFSQIQSHSTVQNDLITNGFWAKDRSGELPNPGVMADFVLDIKEVTSQVLENTQNLTGKDLQSKIDKNIDAVIKSFSIKP